MQSHIYKYAAIYIYTHISPHKYAPTHTYIPTEICTKHTHMYPPMHAYTEWKNKSAEWQGNVYLEFTN